MTTTLRFRDHQEFHRAALQMSAAGLLAGLASFFFFRASSPWPLVLIGAAALVGGLAADGHRSAAGLVLRVGVAAAGAAALWQVPGWGTWIFAFAFAAALTLDGRGSALRSLLGAVAGAGAVLVGIHALDRIAGAALLEAVPAPVVTGLAGGAFALVSAAALVARHLELVRDPIAEAYAAAARDLRGEMRELVDRGHALWSEAEGRLPVGDDNRRTLAEGVTRFFEVARTWKASEADAAAGDKEALAKRMEELDRRIASSVDAVSREQYQRARNALAEQARYLASIDTSRERVVARMHAYLAAMEQFRLAAIRLASSSASRAAVDVAPLVATIEELGADIAACSDGLVEAERALAPGPAVPAETAAEAAEVVKGEVGQA
jgi:hypothetical protein